MELDKIRLVGINTVNLPIIGASLADPYVFKGADGLGPPERENFISQEKLNGSALGARTVVIKLGFNPNWGANQTSGSLRSELYKLFVPGMDELIRLELMLGDTVQAFCMASVKRIEASVFSKDPEVLLTLDCVEKYFMAPAPVSLTPSNNSSFPVNNIGDAPTGFYWEYQFTADGPLGWEVYDDRKPLLTDRFDINMTILNGDILKVNHQAGQRSVKLVRAGTETDALKYLTTTSSWLTLYPGLNPLRRTNPAGVWLKFEYTPRYQGV